MQPPTGNRYTAKCKYCLTGLEGKPERLHQHVLKTKSNPEAPVEIMTESSKSSMQPARQESILNWCSKPMLLVQSERLHLKLLNAIVYEHILTKKFSNYLQKKLTTMSTFTDATICLDGWTDVSGNSIYSFMILKEREEHVIDIINLSTNRHRSSFLMNKTKEILARNRFQMSSAIACVTDNPPIMESMKNLLNKCALQTWQKEQGISHFLSTFCETSETDKINYPEIKENIKIIINDRYHFASNDTLVKIIKLVVDAIGRLESRDATLADIFKKLIYLHLEILRLNVPISSLKAHILAIIGQRAREFSGDIYFIALFLFPSYKNIAISNYMNSDRLLRECLELAKAWNFNKRETSLLYNELVNYKNNDLPFDNINSNIHQSPRTFWTGFSDNSPFFADSSRKFSPLLLIVPLIRNELNNLVKKDKPKPVLVPELSEENIDIFFEDMNEESEDEQEEVNEQIEAVNVNDEDQSIMEEYFDFALFEREQEESSFIEQAHDHSMMQQNDTENKE
ncbi:14104_t:CDS:2, partial [Cetraspora pellucida]